MLWGKGNIDWQQRIDFNRLRRDRLEKANKTLDKYGIGSALVYNWDSQRWLGGPWNHPYAKHIPSHFALLIRDAGFPYVHVREGLDDQRVKEDCPWLEGRIVTEEVLSQPPVLRMTPAAEAEKLWTRTAEQIMSLLAEHGVADMPLSVDYAGPHLVRALQNTGATVIDGNAWMQEARMVKTDDEVELMKMAASCNEAGYGALARELRPGMRENDAQGIMAKAIYQAGGEYLEGWVVCSGARTSPRSFNWSDKVIRPGELMTLEACHVNYCGYKVCYDRTFLVGGKATELQKETYQVAVDMQYRLKELLRPGITTHDVARLRPVPQPKFTSVDDIREHRAGWTNHFGGMGISWNEAPYLTLDEPPVTLEKNMVVAYHAVYYVLGYEGVAVENTWRITDTGCENLCKWPFEDLMVVGT
ncbi:MAG: M24 family metallopeptidase [Dehalococcoidia bacterium]